MRNIYNTADRDDTYSVFPGGASGIPETEFYLSQIETYLEGRFYRDYYSNDAVKRSALYKMVFKP